MDNTFPNMMKPENQQIQTQQTAKTKNMQITMSKPNNTIFLHIVTRYWDVFLCSNRKLK